MGREPARKKRTMRRGFTLLETMIVVLIVTAISAIILPSLASRATDGRLGLASRSLESGAALAAARAMERGTIVALVAEDWGGEWVLWAEDVEPERVGEVLASGGGDPASAPVDPRTVQRVELASFDRVELTDRLPALVDSLTGEPDGAAGNDAAGAEGADGPAGSVGEEASLLAPGEHERHVLGVFFPDGSCRAGPAVYLLAEDGRREVVRFSPLTGRVDVRGLPSTLEEAEQQAARESAGAPLPETGTGDAGGRRGAGDAPGRVGMPGPAGRGAGGGP